MNKTKNNPIIYILFSLLVLLFSVCPSFSQPVNMPINYVKESVYPTATAIAPGYTIETYFDGLGRELQKISRYPLCKHHIEIKGYDSYGRAYKNYLLFPTSNKKDYNYSATSEQTTYYRTNYGTFYGYSEVVYDNTTSNNVIEASKPGLSWRIDGDHTTKRSVTKNVAGDHIRLYTIVNDTTVVYDGSSYPAGVLVKKETIDPQGSKVYEYYDIHQNLIAEEVKDGTGSIYTYYLYDDLGLLRYVIPPTADELFTSGASKNLQELKKYCFYTEYDERRHPYKNYVPGGGCTINLYDKQDRLVLYQNETMRSQGKWFFTKYDELDRPIITGVCTGTEAQHKAALDAQTIFSETRENVLHGYSNQSYPTSVTGNDCLTVTYYDNYDWQGEIDGGTTVSAWSDPEFPQPKNEKVGGLVTGAKQKVLGITENKWLLSANYYDDKYHEIQTVNQLYPGGIGLVYRTYDFLGKLTRVREKQTIGAKMEGFDRYLDYDTQGRLSNVKQKMLGYVSTELVSIAKYTYNDLWQISEKTNHNGIDTTRYTYSIDGQQIGATSPLFSYKLYFDTRPNNMSPIDVRFDGNICMMEWTSEGKTKGYKYAYDGLKQLKEGKYMTVQNSEWVVERGYDERDITYDLNGNIITLNRSDSRGGRLHEIDNEYDGNQLINSYINGEGWGYVYDGNGNMIYDGHKGINISYNYLNLPEKIFAGTEEVSYVYSASGQKLATKEGTSTTYYRGSFIYNNDELDHILHPEGMIRKTTGAYVYYYAKQDHLGSTRVLCHEGNGKMLADQTTDYYPFGLTFRNTNTNVNRYLFSGKEFQDQTVNGSRLMLYDFGARNYDPILGRWFNIDPALQFTNPYIYCANNPMRFIDPDGRTIQTSYSADGRPKYFNWEKGEGVWSFYSSETDADGNVTKVPYEFGTDGMMDVKTIALNKLMEGETGRLLVTSLAEMKEVVTIGLDKEGKNRFYKQENGNSDVSWNPKEESKVPTQRGGDQSVYYVTLGHELAHSWNYSRGKMNFNVWLDKAIYNLRDDDVRYGDIYATHVENKIRAEHILQLRTHYLIDQSGFGVGPRILDFKGRSIFFNTNQDRTYMRVSPADRHRYY